MSSFKIITDSGCDISPELLTAWGVGCRELSFRRTDNDRQYRNGELPVSEFYREMREGTVFQTAAVNADTFRELFAKEAEAGNDILYLGFSSGLSGTYNAGRIAAEEVEGMFPERKILAVDTLSASAGQGLLVYLAAKKRDDGASLEETAAYVQGLVPCLSHWFTVDDLVYLKRGGRISAAAAFAATALGIKPVMHVDDEGHLVNVKKVRGRKQAVKELAAQFSALLKDPENSMYFISHGDCMEDAKYLETLLCGICGHGAELITDIGPVIGSHAGPGTLALFFVGSGR